MAYEDIGKRPVILVDGYFGHALKDCLARHQLAKDGMFEVEVRAWRKRDEELTAVRILSPIGHTD